MIMYNDITVTVSWNTLYEIGDWAKEDAKIRRRIKRLKEKQKRLWQKKKENKSSP